MCPLQRSFRAWLRRTRGQQGDTNTDTQEHERARCLRQQGGAASRQARTAGASRGRNAAPSPPPHSRPGAASRSAPHPRAVQRDSSGGRASPQPPPRAPPATGPASAASRLGVRTPTPGVDRLAPASRAGGKRPSMGAMSMAGRGTSRGASPAPSNFGGTAGGAAPESGRQPAAMQPHPQLGSMGPAEALMAAEEGGAAWHPHAAAAARDGTVVFPPSLPPLAHNGHSGAPSARVQEGEYQTYAVNQLGSESNRNRLPGIPPTALSRGDSMGSVQTSESCQGLPGPDEDEQADAVARVVADEDPDDDGVPLRPASIMGAEGATALDGLGAGASLEAAGAEERMQLVYASALYAPATLRAASGQTDGADRSSGSSSGNASPAVDGGAEEAGKGRAESSSGGLRVPPGAAGGTAVRGDASPAPGEARGSMPYSPHISHSPSPSPAPSSPLDELLRVRERALEVVQDTPQRQQQQEQPQQQPQGGKRQGLLAALWGSGRSFTRRQLPELPPDTLLTGSGMPIMQRQTSRSQAGAPCSLDVELLSNMTSANASDSGAAAATHPRPGRVNSVGSMLRKHLPPATPPHTGGLVGMAAPDWVSPSVRGPQPPSPGPWPGGGPGTGPAGSPLQPQPSPGRRSVEPRVRPLMSLQQRSHSPAPAGVERSSHSELLMVGSGQGAGQGLLLRSPARTLGGGRSTTSGCAPPNPLGKLRGDPWAPADIAQLHVTRDKQQQQEDGSEGDKEHTHSPSSCHGPHPPPVVVASRNCVSLDLARLGGSAGAAASPSGSLPPLPGSPMAAAGAVVWGGGAVASPGSRRQLLMGAEPSPGVSPKGGVRAGSGCGAGQGASATGRQARERPWEGGRVPGAVQEGCEGRGAAQRGLEVGVGGANSGVALPSLVTGSGGAGVAQGSGAGAALAVRVAVWEDVHGGGEGGVWEVGSGGGWTAGRGSLDTRMAHIRRAAVAQEARGRMVEAVGAAQGQAQVMVRGNVLRAWKGPGSDT